MLAVAAAAALTIAARRGVPARGAIGLALAMAGVLVITGITYPARYTQAFDLRPMAAAITANVPPSGTVLGHPDVRLGVQFLRAPPHRRGAGTDVRKRIATAPPDAILVSESSLARAGAAGRGGLAGAGVEPAWRPHDPVAGTPAAMSAEPALSIVVPVYDEVENLPQLWTEIKETLGRLGLSAEIVFVDDASTDASAELIRRFMAADPRVRMVTLDPHAGLTAAFHAGFAAARGRIVATLDSDLQNDPRDLVPLLAALDHADAAVGWRQKRNDPWTKRISSRIANAVRNRLTREEVHDSACSLRVMRRECTSAIPPYNGMHRFVPTLLRRAGYRVVEVPVHHRPRRFGRSKFGIRNRALRGFVDLLAVRWMLHRALHYRPGRSSGRPPRASAATDGSSSHRAL